MGLPQSYIFFSQEQTDLFPVPDDCEDHFILIAGQQRGGIVLVELLRVHNFTVWYDILEWSSLLK